MRKVRLNESQLRRLVRGMISETRGLGDYYSTSRGSVAGMDHRHPDYEGPSDYGHGGGMPPSEMLALVRSMRTTLEREPDRIADDRLRPDELDLYDNDGELARALDALDRSMGSAFRTAQEAALADYGHPGDDGTAVRALRSIEMKLERMAEGRRRFFRRRR